MVSSKSQLIEAEPLDTPTKVVLGDRQSLKATHWRRAIIPPSIWLTEVLFVLGLKENLFLVSMASAVNGARIVMENGLCQIIKDNKIALSAKKQGGVFAIMAVLVIEPEEENNTLIDYHRRCSHTNLKTIRLMSRTCILSPSRSNEDRLTMSVRRALRIK
jgi:hypothetical protein